MTTYAVVGSRTYPDLQAVRAYVRSLPLGSTVISGGAWGVDQTAEKTAVACGLRVESWRIVHRTDGCYEVDLVVLDSKIRSVTHLPETFRSFGAAAHWRNRKVVDQAEHVKDFWDGHSRGTAYTRRYAAAAGKLLP